MFANPPTNCIVYTSSENTIDNPNRKIYSVFLEIVNAFIRKGERLLTNSQFQLGGKYAIAFQTGILSICFLMVILKIEIVYEGDSGSCEVGVWGIKLRASYGNGFRKFFYQFLII
jgi:hypothetical protein